MVSICEGYYSGQQSGMYSVQQLPLQQLPLQQQHQQQSFADSASKSSVSFPAWSSTLGMSIGSLLNGSVSPCTVLQTACLPQAAALSQAPSQPSLPVCGAPLSAFTPFQALPSTPFSGVPSPSTAASTHVEQQNNSSNSLFTGSVVPFSMPWSGTFLPTASLAGGVRGSGSTVVGSAMDGGFMTTPSFPNLWGFPFSGVNLNLVGNNTSSMTSSSAVSTAAISGSPVAPVRPIAVSPTHAHAHGHGCCSKTTTTTVTSTATSPSSQSSCSSPLSPVPVTSAVSAESPSNTLSDSSEIGTFSCTHCDKTFSVRWNMVRHIRTVHEGRRDFECPVCNERFGTKGHMHTHVRTVHEGRKDFNCSVCAKRFGQKGALRTHMRTVHEGRRDFGCQQCGKHYAQKGDLNSHLRNVHGVTSPLTP